MAGAGPTMLLREENGCCSRRQSSSSAGVSVGSGSGGAVGQQHRVGRGRGRGWRGWKRNCSSRQPMSFGQRRAGSWEL